MPYGTTFSKSAAEDIIRSSNVYKNRVTDWTNILTSGIAQSNLAYQTDVSSQTSAFGSAMSDAYKSSQMQQTRWQGSGLGQYSAQKYMGMEKENLVNLYNQYIGQYNQNIATLGKQTAIAQQKLLNEYVTNMAKQEELTEEYGKNYATAMNLGYDWLIEEGQHAIISRNRLKEDGSPDYEMEGKGKKVAIKLDSQGKEVIHQDEFNFLDEQGMSWLFTGEGDNRTLLSRSQINNILLDKDNKLTARGDQFFDFLLNMVMEHGYEVDGRAGITYDEWLYGKDSKLHDWLWEADEFSEPYEKDGKTLINSRLDTLRSMTGVTGDEYDKRRHTLNVAVDKTADSPTFLANEIKEHTQKEFNKDATLSKSLVEGIKGTATHTELERKLNGPDRTLGYYETPDNGRTEMIALSKDASGIYAKKLEKINATIKELYGIDVSTSDVYTLYKNAGIRIPSESRSITPELLREQGPTNTAEVNRAYMKLIEDQKATDKRAYDELFADIKAADKRLEDYQEAIAKYIIKSYSKERGR